MDKLLTVENLSYSRNLQKILENLSLTLSEGQIVGLLGANGAGKTTLMRLIAGNYIQHNGSITINGSDDPIEHKTTTSFTEQASELKSGQRLFKLAEFYKDLYPDFNLADFNRLASTLELDLNKRLNRLSKGNQRKFTIAVTLARRSSLYLLDEPFDGIDSMTRKKIIASIIEWKPDNATMLISDHHVADVANLLDEVVIIKDQTVIAQEDADTIRETLGKDIESYYEDFYKGDIDHD